MVQKKTIIIKIPESIRAIASIISYLLIITTLGLGIYLNLALIHLIIFVLLVVVILRPTNSRQLATVSLAFFVLLFVFIFLKQYEYVEQSSIGIYIFFALSILTAIFENRTNDE